MSRAAALALSLTACGRIAFEPTEPDASACVGGSCEPVTMLSALPEPSLITSDDLHLYWSSFTSQVLTCAKADCSGTVTAIDSVPELTHGIAIDATRVYWTNSGSTTGAIEACPLAGCGAAPPTVLASGLASAYFLAVDASNAYWTDDVGGNVMSCPLTGCGSTPTVIASGEVSPHGIAVTDTTVYWADAGTTGAAADGSIRSCPKTGCAGMPTTVVAMLPSPWSIAIDARSYLYWTERTTGGQLIGCPLADCAAAITVFGDYSFTLVVDDGHGIYFSGETGYITYAPFDGSALVRIASPGGDSRGLTSDASSVYWVDRGGASGGMVMKVAKRN